MSRTQIQTLLGRQIGKIELLPENGIAFYDEKGQLLFTTKSDELHDGVLKFDISALVEAK